MTWLEEASFVSQTAENGTVWLKGYLRPPMNMTLTFRLDTNVDSILFLSNDENPDHAVQIARQSSPQSGQMRLLANTKFVIRNLIEIHRHIIRIHIVTICFVLARLKMETYESPSKPKCKRLHRQC